MAKSRNQAKAQAQVSTSNMLTASKQQYFRAALYRSIRKWEELSLSDKCSDKCKEYNNSQITQLIELGKWLMIQPTVASSEEEQKDYGF